MDRRGGCPVPARRRHAAAAAVVVVVVALVVGLTSCTGDDERSGSREHFFSYLATYFPGWSSSADPGGPQRDQRWLTAHRTEALAYGRRACAWLSTQPDAPADERTDRFTPSAVVQRYMVGSPSARGLPVTGNSRYTIVVAAWSTLCPSVYSRKAVYRDDDE